MEVKAEAESEVAEGYSAQFYDHLRRETGDSDVRNYCYAGGRTKSTSHYNYWTKTLGYTDDTMPPYVTSCACGHPIKENCFIRHKPTGKIIVLGNCCIKKYIPDSGRTCDRCGNPHRNRKDNRCNSCRMYRNCNTCKKEHALNEWDLGRLGDTPFECIDCKRIVKVRAEIKMRVYIQVPFEEKDIAKSLGARWEKLCKSWYVIREPTGDLLRFPKYGEVKQKEFCAIVEKSFG